jgi:hypothetical protein
MSDNKDRPSIDERYTNATHATKLTVDPDHTGAADMLIAAGWSQSRLGTALLRLISEWDGAQKPQPLNPRAIGILATQIGKESGREPTERDYMAARIQANQWFEHENKILMGKLKTLPEIRAVLTVWVKDRGIGNPEQVAAESLLWWMDSLCKHCSGRKWESIKDTGRLSGIVCPVCRGTGEKPRPGGIRTVQVLAYLDLCVYKGRQGMKQRLRQYPVAQKESSRIQS